jgi:Trp operon repressor
MVVGQRDDPGGELDALRPFAGRGQEHLGRADHLPAAGMMLAAPELVVSELVEVLDKVEIAAELQHRMLADRMMGREERAKAQTRHGEVECLLTPSLRQRNIRPNATDRGRAALTS